MRAFACPRCGQLVFFENVECLRCGAGLGFDPEVREMVRVADGWGDDPTGGVGAAGGVRPPDARCANQRVAGCNWVLPQPQPAAFCRSCLLTRARPNDADLEQDPHIAEEFLRAEAAKRRLVFQLLELNLRLVSRHDDPDHGLAFDFLIRTSEPITIGHADGVITIDLAESDDAYRERLRAELGEPYRTMLGHLRHEVGHHYWEVLVVPVPEALASFRCLFGDERADYQQALERHYNDGPPPGWAEHHVSAYAAAHPWEDWAESWAHYLHIRDSLQTAAAHGVIVTGPRFLPDRAPAPTAERPAPEPTVDPELEASLMSAPPLEPQAGLDDILADWLPLTYALNAINRSMGKDDLYPFVLSPEIIEKLRFVHERVLGAESGVSSERAG